MDTPQVSQSLRRLAHVASLHSQRYLLSDYTLTRLAEEQVDEISTQLLRLFERLYEEAEKKSSQTEPRGQNGGGSGQDPRTRLRDQ